MFEYKSTMLKRSLLILCVAQIATSCSPDLVKKGTEIAKDSGLSGAGDSCSDDGKCKEMLVCNQVPDEAAFAATKGECQVQSWLIGISLTLMILVPVCLLVIIFHCCHKHHCFSRILWKLTKRESNIF